MKSSHHEDNDVEVLADAIACMNKAIKYGYDREMALFEIGRMHEASGESGKSLTKYKQAFKVTETNLTLGLYYCLAWVRGNVDALNKSGFDEIVTVLKKIGNLGVYNSKMAYAVLWFVYVKMGSKEADVFYGKTNDYEIKELFVMPCGETN